LRNCCTCDFSSEAFCDAIHLILPIFDQDTAGFIKPTNADEMCYWIFVTMDIYECMTHLTALEVFKYNGSHTTTIVAIPG